MTIDTLAQRISITLGDMTNPDDPRGREFTAGIDLGIPTGEFDSSMSGPAEYGTWGIWLTIWRWGIRIALRGPIVGHYPPDEDDDEPPLTNDCGLL